MRVYWAKLQNEENILYKRIEELEKELSNRAGINDMIFFYSDGYCGIGNISRSMKLYHPEDFGA